MTLEEILGEFVDAQGMGREYLKRDDGWRFLRPDISGIKQWAAENPERVRKAAIRSVYRRRAELKALGLCVHCAARPGSARHSECQARHRQRVKESNQRHREALLQRKRSYYKLHAEELRAKQRQRQARGARGLARK